MDRDLSSFLNKMGGAEKASKAVNTAQDKVYEYLCKDIILSCAAVCKNSKEAEVFAGYAVTLLTGLLIQGKINILKRKGK